MLSGLSASERIDWVIAELDDWREERLAKVWRLMRGVEPEVVGEWTWMEPPVFKATKHYCAVWDASET